MVPKISTHGEYGGTDRAVLASSTVVPGAVLSDSMVAPKNSPAKEYGGEPEDSTDGQYNGTKEQY